MTKKMLIPVLAVSSLLFFGVCIRENRGLEDEVNSAPIVLTLYEKTGVAPEEDPHNMSISGSLLSSSPSGLPEASEVEMISGKTHGVPATGFAVYTSSSRDKPVFSVLRGRSATDGKHTVVLSGESSVAWRLIVEDEDGVILQDGEAVKSANAFSPGSFEVQVLYPSGDSISEGEETTQGVESEDPRPR